MTTPTPRHASALHRLTSEHTTQPVVWLDEAGRIVQANASAGTVLECAPSGLVGRHLLERYDRPGPAAWPALIAGLRDTGVLYLCAERSSGLAAGRREALRARYVEVDGTGYVIVFFEPDPDDSTLERAAREGEEKFRTLAETTSAAAFIHRGAEFLYFNQATVEISGYSRAELRRMSFIDVVHPDDRDMVRERALARLRDEAVPSCYEIRIVCRDGSVRWLEITGNPLTLGGEPAVIGTAFDITERKQAELELQRTNAELVRANRELKSLDEMKMNLISNISHELRTPLVTVRGYAELIADGRAGPTTEAQRRYLEIALRSVERLTELIDQLLEHSRLALGRGELQLDPVDVVELAQELVAFVDPRAQREGVALRLAPVDRPLVARGDRGKLGQVLLNLLDNAVKFTPRGGQVRVGFEAEADARVWIEVADTGVGIAPEELERIFERFHQADPTVTRQYGGLGIGLALSREIVELHGGRLEVTSTPGQGAEFRFCLPMAAEAERAPAPATSDRPPGPATAPGRGRAVLIVDDDPDVLEFLEVLVSSAGYAAFTAADCAAAERILAEQAVELVLLDIAMPGRDGLDLLKGIKGRPSTADVPILMLTARAELAVREQALAAGAAGFVVKPVETERLLQLMDQAMGPSAA